MRYMYHIYYFNKCTHENAPVARIHVRPLEVSRPYTQ